MNFLHLFTHFYAVVASTVGRKTWEEYQLILTRISSLGYALSDVPVGGLGFSSAGAIDDIKSTGSIVWLNSFSSSAAFFISSCSRSENCYKQNTFVVDRNPHTENSNEIWQCLSRGDGTMVPLWQEVASILTTRAMKRSRRKRLYASVDSMP